MYNLNSHYENIYRLAQTIIADPRLVYLVPFGSTNPENLEELADTEMFGEDDPRFWSRGPLLICHDQEPLDPIFNRDLLHHIKYSYLPNHILLHTEKNSVNHKIIMHQHQFEASVYYFFHAFAAHDWYRGYRYDSRLKPIRNRKLTKKYITFNRLTGNTRVYRSLLISELVKYNILDQGYVSYNKICPEVPGDYKHHLSVAVEQFGVPVELANQAIQNIDSIKHELRIDYKDWTSIPNGSQTLSGVNETQESFLHVVSETCFWDKKCHLTEKIFKPIVARQPFVLLGCANNLAYLKEYGFKTFDRWWDESYDSIENPVERLQAVGEIIKQICNYSLEELTEMLHEMEEVLEYNYNRFYSNEFLDYCWDELKENLTSAIQSLPPNASPNTFVSPEQN